MLWTFTPVKDEVKALIITKLQPYLGESFLINDFDMGLSYIEFSRVHASNESQSFAIELDRILIGYSMRKLITSGFDPAQAITTVKFKRPQLSLLYSDEMKVRQNRDFSLEKLLEEVLVGLQKAPQIDHISVVDAEWFLDLPGGGKLPILDHLDGRLDYRPNKKVVFINLRGKFIGVEKSSIDLVGNVNFEDKTLTADLVLDECLITSDWPFWKINFFKIRNAWLQGKIQLNSNTLQQDSLILGGEIQVREFAADVFNQHTKADSFTMKLVNRKVEVQPFDCTVEDASGKFHGIFTDIFSPEVDWWLDFEKYSLKHLVQAHNVFQYVYDGKLAGRVHFTGPIKKMRIDADVTSPDILYGVVPFNSTKVRLEYDHSTKRLNLPYLRADYFKWRTEGTGTMEFHEYTTQMDLNSYIDVPDGYFSLLNGLNDGRVGLKWDLKGDFNRKLFTGNGRYTVQRGDSVLARGRGPLRLDYNKLDFRLNPENLANDYGLSGTIENLWDVPNVKIMEARNFPVKEFTVNPLLAKMVEGKAVDFYFAGPYNMLSTKMKVMSKDRATNHIVLNGSIKDIFYDNQAYEGRFTAYSAPKKIDGKYKVRFSEKGIDTRIFSSNLFDGSIYFGYKPSSPFRGNVKIHHFSVAEYLQNISTFSQLFQEGSLAGELTIDGTVGDPQLRFDLAATEFIVNNVGYYDTRFSGKLEKQVLKFDNSWVRLNGERVFNADITYDTARDSLEMLIRAEDVESNFLAETIFKDRDLIRGSFTYALKALGNLASPSVQGDVQVRNGEVKGTPFDLITVTFEDSLVANAETFWDAANHFVKLRRFTYMNSGAYSIEGSGYMSIDQHGPLDIQIDVEGNVLAELPRIEPYFVKPRTDGSLYAHVQGSRVNPYFKEVDLVIRNGSIEFDGLIPPVTGLKAEVKLTDEDNFVEIRTLEGAALGRMFRMYNEKQVFVEDSLELDPLYFNDMGLNFGTLVLDTDPLGFPLSVYGMMEEGDIGYFATRGNDSDEKFYFSGPVEDPYLRGTALMYDCRVTFPFIGMVEDGGEYAYPEDDKVIDFLMNLRTDFSLLTGNNNRYFVNVPGYVGEVFMDLKLDNDSPGLTFKGRFVDESWRILGGVQSSRGRVEYLDVKFRVDRFGADFTNYEILPEVYGRAYTTVRDTTDFPRDILLQLYVIDPVTKQEVNKGRWEDFRFKLVSRERPSDPLIEETQENLLSYLGYSFDNLSNKAGEVGLTMTENFLIRPLYRPLERQLEKQLNLDYVRVRSSFTTNLFYLGFQQRAKISAQPWFFTPTLNNSLNPALLLLQSSELTLGKYILRDVYLTYSGQLVSGVDDSKLGVNHSFGLEYRLLNNLLLEVEYDRYQFNPFYENLPSDFLIRFRHSFNF
ncbi:MAG: hypothetical protein ACRBF0_23390 [Calditrichia bacterium]